MIAEQVTKELPKKALTHGVVYPMVKKVAKYLGVKMTTQSFAKGDSVAPLRRVTPARRRGAGNGPREETVRPRPAPLGCGA